MALFTVELLLSLAFSTVVLAMVGYTCLFVWLFRLRRQQFGFQKRRGGLTELSAMFCVVYWSQRVMAVWLAFLGATRKAHSGRPLPFWQMILVLCYDVLNPLSIFGVGLTIALRMWLIFYDLNLALISGDERWTTMIEHFPVDVEQYQPCRSGSTRSASSGLVSSLISTITQRLLSVGTGSTPRSAKSDGLTPRIHALSPSNWRRKSTGLIHMSSIHKVEPTVLQSGKHSTASAGYQRARAHTDQGLSPIISPITPVFAESDALTSSVEPLTLDSGPILQHSAGAMSAPLPTMSLNPSEMHPQKSDTTTNGTLMSVMSKPAMSLSLDYTEEEKTGQLKSEFLPASRPPSLLSIVSNGRTKSQVSWEDETRTSVIIEKQTTIDDAELGSEYGKDKDVNDDHRGNNDDKGDDDGDQQHYYEEDEGDDQSRPSMKMLQLRLDQGESTNTEMEEEKRELVVVVQDEQGIETEPTQTSAVESTTITVVRNDADRRISDDLMRVNDDDNDEERKNQVSNDTNHAREQLSLPVPPEDDDDDGDDSEEQEYEDEDALSIISESQPKLENWYYENRLSYGSFKWVLWRIYFPCFSGLFVISLSLRLLTLILGNPLWASLVSVVLGIWLLISFIFGFMLYFQFPRYHDSLLLFDELTFVSVITLLSLVTYLPFLVLLVAGWAREGQFYLELLLSCVVVLDSFAITMVQTHWVLHTFQNKRAYLKNSDIYMDNVSSMLASQDHNNNHGRNDDDDDDDDLMDGPGSMCYYMLCCMDLAVSQMHGGIRQIRELHRSHSLYGWTGGALSLIGIPSKSLEANKTTSTTEQGIGGSSYGEMSTTAHSQSIRTNLTAQMKAVLSDETALRLFMAHLFTEMAYESLVAVIELVAFTKYLLRKHNALTPHGIHILQKFREDKENGGMDDSEEDDNDEHNDDQLRSTDHLTNEDLARTRRVLMDFPPYVERLRSTIVFHKKLTIQQKYLALCDKYIISGTQLTLNISHECRLDLLDFAERVKKNQWLRYRANLGSNASNNQSPSALSTVPKSGSIDAAMGGVSGVEAELPIPYDVFFTVILEVQRLLRDAYMRFQRTERMRKLMHEAPYLFGLEHE